MHGSELGPRMEKKKKKEMPIKDIRASVGEI